MATKAVTTSSNKSPAFVSSFQSAMQPFESASVQIAGRQNVVVAARQAWRTYISAYNTPPNTRHSFQSLPISTEVRDGLVEARIGVLKAASDEEGIEWSRPSEKGLLAFLKLVPQAKRPSIVLSDTGELRAVWDNDSGEQIGLRFRAMGDVQFVLFRKRANAPLARSSGVDDAKVVRQQIDALGLKRLMDQ